MTQRVLWEASVRKYEALSGVMFDADMRVAFMVAHAPPELRQRLRLNYSTFEGDPVVVVVVVVGGGGGGLAVGR